VPWGGAVLLALVKDGGGGASFDQLPTLKAVPWPIGALPGVVSLVKWHGSTPGRVGRPRVRGRPTLPGMTLLVIVSYLTV